jgi:hypothetical protein
MIALDRRWRIALFWMRNREAIRSGGDLLHRLIVAQKNWGLVCKNYRARLGPLDCKPCGERDFDRWRLVGGERIIAKPRGNR